MLRSIKILIQSAVLKNENDLDTKLILIQSAVLKNENEEVYIFFGFPGGGQYFFGCFLEFEVVSL